MGDGGYRYGCDGGAGDCRGGDAGQSQVKFLRDVLQPIWLEMAKTQKAILAMILKMEKTSKCVRYLAEDAKSHRQRVRSLLKRFATVEKRLDSCENEDDIADEQREHDEKCEGDSPVACRMPGALKTLERRRNSCEAEGQNDATMLGSRGDDIEESIQAVLESSDPDDDADDWEYLDNAATTNDCRLPETHSLPNFSSDSVSTLSTASSSSLASSFTVIRISPSCPTHPVCRTASFVESTRLKRHSGKHRALLVRNLKKTRKGRARRRSSSRDSSSTSASSSGNAAPVYRSASDSDRPSSIHLPSKDVERSLLKTLFKRESPRRFSSCISSSSSSLSGRSSSPSNVHDFPVRRTKSGGDNLPSTSKCTSSTVGRNRFDVASKSTVKVSQNSFSTSTVSSTSETSVTSSPAHFANQEPSHAHHSIHTTEMSAERVMAENRVLKALLFESVKEVKKSLNRNISSEVFRSLSTCIQASLEHIQNGNVSDDAEEKVKNRKSHQGSSVYVPPVSSSASSSSSPCSSFSSLNSDILFSSDAYAVQPVVCRSESAMRSTRSSLNQDVFGDQSWKTTHDWKMNTQRGLKRVSDTTIATSTYDMDRMPTHVDRIQNSEKRPSNAIENEKKVETGNNLSSCVSSSSSSLTSTTYLSSPDAVHRVVCRSGSGTHRTKAFAKHLSESEHDEKTEDASNGSDKCEEVSCHRLSYSDSNQKIPERDNLSNEQLDEREYEISRRSDSSNSSLTNQILPSFASHAVHPVSCRSEFATEKGHTPPEKDIPGKEMKATKHEETTEVMSHAPAASLEAISSPVTPSSPSDVVHLGISRSMSSIASSQSSSRDMLGIKLLTALQDGKMTEFLNILKLLSPSGEIPNISSSFVTCEGDIDECDQLDGGTTNENYASPNSSVTSLGPTRFPSDTKVSKTSVDSAKTFPKTTADRNMLGMKLIKACQEGKIMDVRRLLRRGANVNFANSWNWTPLHWAAVKGHARVVSHLLKNNADVHFMTNCGNTAMHMASCNCNSRCVRLLLDAGSGVDKWNHFGRTPLHLAALGGNVEVVKTLVDVGASRSAKDKEGKTPFHVAKVDYVRRLLHF